MFMDFPASHVRFPHPSGRASWHAILWIEFWNPQPKHWKSIPKTTKYPSVICWGWFQDIVWISNPKNKPNWFEVTFLFLSSLSWKSRNIWKRSQRGHHRNIAIEKVFREQNWVQNVDSSTYKSCFPNKNPPKILQKSSLPNHVVV